MGSVVVLRTVIEEKINVSLMRTVNVHKFLCPQYDLWLRRSIRNYNGFSFLACNFIADALSYSSNLTSHYERQNAGVSHHANWNRVENNMSHVNCECSQVSVPMHY